MKRYLVLVYGRNFRIAFGEGRRTVIKLTGFTTTRCVVARNSVAAEHEAIDLVRRDPKLQRSVHNSRTDPPLVRVIRIREVESFAPLKPPGTGYVFFHGRGAGRPRHLPAAARTPGKPRFARKAIRRKR